VTSVTLYRPSFEIDTTGVGVEGDDYVAEDLAPIVGCPRVHHAAVALYSQAGSPPTLALSPTPGNASALAACLRIGGYRALAIHRGTDTPALRQAMTGLADGSLGVVVSCRRVIDTRPIVGLRGLMMVWPTANREHHRCMIGKLGAETGAVVFDLVGNVARFGEPIPDKTMVGDHIDVIRDPMLDRLADLPHKQCMDWAGNNIERGTYNATAHRDRKREPEPEGLKLTPPRDMTAAQKAIWKRVVETAPKGVLFAIDETMLRLWCETVDRRNELQRILEEERGGTRSSRRSRYRRNASQRLRRHRLRPSQQSRDRSGPGKNLHPMSQSRKGSSTRDNEQMIERARKRLRKRAKRGLRGYPVATVALYGPNDARATKLTVGILTYGGTEHY
jgi:hypothetical protein